MTDRTKQYEEELIRRAERGDSESGKEILKSLVYRIDAKDWNSPLFDYLAECLWLYANENIPIDRALGVEDDPNIGGRPSKYDEMELAVVDIILRDHANYKPEKSIIWITENIGADRRTIQKIRKIYDSRYNPITNKPLTESLDKEDLLCNLSKEMRIKVAEVLPHI